MINLEFKDCFYSRWSEDVPESSDELDRDITEENDNSHRFNERDET